MQTNRISFYPILLIDHDGLIGDSLAKELAVTYSVVYATGKFKKPEKNIAYIYYKKVPKIPDRYFSSLVIIDNGEKEIADLLPTYLDRARVSQTPLLFITSIYAKHSKLLLASLYAYQKAAVFFYGDILGSKFDSTISKFIYESQTFGRITLENDGLSKSYPVFLEDVVKAIKDRIFAYNNQKQFFLFPKYPYTQLAIARAIKHIYPLVQIYFKKIKEKRPTISSHIGSGLYVFGEQYRLEDRLRKIEFFTFPREHKNSYPIQKEQKKHIVRLFAGILFLLVFIISFPILCAFIGVLELNRAEKAIHSGDITNAHKSAQLGVNAFMLSEDTNGPLIFFASAIGKNEQAQKYLSVGKQVAQASNDIFSSLYTYKEIYDGKSKNPKNDFLHAISEIKQAVFIMQTVQAEQSLPKTLAPTVTKMNGMVNTFNNIFDALPTLLGFDKSMKYLVLFQNNMELRPGGGFIGSYGILSIEKGRVKQLSIQDVYNADGQLKGHVEPPFGLKRYLGSTHWFLRDSNFSVDFSKDAENAAFFLKEETGEKVDGVIAIDTTVLTDILSTIGPVFVPEYKEQVTADNFFKQTELHAEKNFFPGSTQKKDFLSSFNQALLLRFSENRSVPYMPLVQTIRDDLIKKHILLAVSYPSIQSIFTIDDFSSSLQNQSTVSGAAIVDIIGVNEANLGMNKVNYYLKRSINQEVQFNDSQINSKLTIRYKNVSKKDSLFGGDYKAFIRIIAPPHVQVESINIDNISYPIVPAVTDEKVYKGKNFTPPDGIEVQKETFGNISTNGFYLEIPTQTEKTVTISYTQVLNQTNQEFTYDLFLFKQPGTGDDSYNLTLLYPSTLIITAVNQPVIKEGDKLQFKTNLSEDKELQIDFARQQ